MNGMVYSKGDYLIMFFALAIASDGISGMIEFISGYLS